MQLKYLLNASLLCFLALNICAQKGLKDYYQTYFPIGVAVSAESLTTNDTQLILKQFNSITPENAMKMAPIHPVENVYNWQDADAIVNFAVAHGLKVRGHTLCWHNQTPSWLFKDKEGNQVSKVVLLDRLKAHITAVVSRYKGKVYAWDVVNEAISDKPDEYLRQSEWYKICGEDFIAKAFEYAHNADPKAILFYNDYNEISPVKRAKICHLIKNLQQKGVPIHAVGLQSHWAINEPSALQLDSTLQTFAALNIKVQITELDVSTYPKEHEARDRIASDSNTTFTQEKEAAQIAIYSTVFKLFRQYQSIISGVTFWNITDKQSWLDNFPVKNRKDYPLLFDTTGQPKKAFFSVTQF